MSRMTSERVRPNGNPEEMVTARNRGAETDPIFIRQRRRKSRTVEVRQIFIRPFPLLEESGKQK